MDSELQKLLNSDGLESSMFSIISLPDLIFSIVISAICMYFGGKIADAKGRSRASWVWWTALTGPVALLILVCMPALETDDVADTD